MSAKILDEDPIVALIAEPRLKHEGVQLMTEWVRDRRPDCLSEETKRIMDDEGRSNLFDLFPHRGVRKEGGPLTDAELLVELAGRKCYDSFGEKAGRRTNCAYIENTQRPPMPHASIMYHAHFTFFIGGVSRRVSHELIRHYVGSSRNEEGSPSQESTRYVEHSGRYVQHPGLPESEVVEFQRAMDINRKLYLEYIERRVRRHKYLHNEEPKGMDRKRIFETASSFLSHSAETSFIWTSNPVALAKFFVERGHEAADLEIQRLARVWLWVMVAHAPNLFPNHVVSEDEQ